MPLLRAAAVLALGLALPYLFPPPCEPLRVSGSRALPLCAFSGVWPHIRLVNYLGAWAAPDLDASVFARRSAALAERYPVAAARAFPLAAAAPDPAAEDFRVVAEEANAAGNAMTRIVLAEEAETALHRRERLLRFFEAHPEVADRPVRAPIVLCGLPRTGSSMLQRLLALDPNARSLPLWVLEADPLHAPGAGDPDLAAARASAGAAAEAGIAALRYVSPDAYDKLMRWHRMTAESPEEDIMWMYASTPSAWDMAWMLLGDHAGASATLRRALASTADKAVMYEYLERLLQAWSTPRNPFVASAAKGRDGLGAFWVLKSHLHTLHLPLLLDRFPDARVVVMHRDVRDVVAS